PCGSLTHSLPGSSCPPVFSSDIGQGEGDNVAEKTVLVCDVCGAEPAQTVALRIGRANWHKDLCQSHMTELLNGACRPTRGPRPGSRNRATATGATRKMMTRKAAPRSRKRASR